MWILLWIIPGILSTLPSVFLSPRYETLGRDLAHQILPWLLIWAPQDLEAELDGRFVRIHRGAMVNRDRIREVRRRGNAVWVVLQNGRVLPVSRSARGRL